MHFTLCKRLNFIRFNLHIIHRLHRHRLIITITIIITTITLMAQAMDQLNQLLSFPEVTFRPCVFVERAFLSPRDTINISPRDAHSTPSLTLTGHICTFPVLSRPVPVHLYPLSSVCHVKRCLLRCHLTIVNSSLSHIPFSPSPPYRPIRWTQWLDFCWVWSSFTSLCSLWAIISNSSIICSSYTVTWSMVKWTQSS